MSILTARRFATALAFTLALALCSMVSPMLATPARAEVVGNTYTSPQYGYSLTWDESWVVVQDSSEEVDVIQLANGFAFCGDGRPLMSLQQQPRDSSRTFRIAGVYVKRDIIRE